MSVCGQTEEETASEEAGPREAYEQKSVSKVVRVLTVLAYLLSVSLAAILLSVYYVCVWKSPELPKLNVSDVELAARRADPPLGNHTEQLNTGGSGISVKAPSDQPAAANIADGPGGSPGAASSENPGAATEPQYSRTPYATPADDHTAAWRADNSSVT